MRERESKQERWRKRESEEEGKREDKEGERRRLVWEMGVISGGGLVVCR